MHMLLTLRRQRLLPFRCKLLKSLLFFCIKDQVEHTSHTIMFVLNRIACVSLHQPSASTCCIDKGCVCVEPPKQMLTLQIRGSGVEKAGEGR